MKLLFLALWSLLAINNPVEFRNETSNPSAIEVVTTANEDYVTIDPFWESYNDGEVVIYGIQIVNNTRYHVFVQVTYYDNDGKHVRTYSSDTWGLSNTYKFRTNGPARINRDRDKTFWDYMYK